jgi:hypothetical protein
LTFYRISIEAGGNAPFIVFNDADIDQAVEGGLASIHGSRMRRSLTLSRNIRCDSLQVPWYRANLYLCEPHLRPIQCIRRVRFPSRGASCSVQSWKRP